MTTIQKPMTPLSQTDLKFLAYNRYQMDTLAKKNIGIREIWDTLRAIAKVRSDYDLTNPDVTEEFNVLWTEMMYNEGIQGTKVLSFTDFINQKYADTSYMHTILTSEEFDRYCELQNLPRLSDAQLFAKTHNLEECVETLVYHETGYNDISPYQSTISELMKISQNLQAKTDSLETPDSIKDKEELE